jgi:hypothetical protein
LKGNKVEQIFSQKGIPIMVCFFVSFNYFGLSKMNRTMTQLPKYIFLIGFLFFVQSIFAQENKSKEALKIFQRVEEGINDNSVDKFANYFSQRNYLSLNNSSAGYFSFNQSYYVLKDYLSIYQPISFKLNNIVTETANPFAAGTFKYINKGVKGTAIIFIALHWSENQWKISQITIN